MRILKVEVSFKSDPIAEDALTFLISTHFYTYFMNTSIGDLKTKGVVNLAYPADVRKVVIDAVHSWKEFCALPASIRTTFPYNKNGGLGVGYELKKTAGSTLDLKEDFHFTHGTVEWLRTEAAQVNNQVVSQLVSKADQLVNVIEPFILDFAQMVEAEFSLPGFANEVLESKDMWFVRFLHYFGGRKAGEEIATSHADKSGFTLHLYESDPGLQHLDFNKTWQDMPVSETETAIIPGMRLQYRSGNQLKAVFHRVVATPKTAEQGRFSMVCFVHLKKTPEVDKEKIGRLQDFPAGFNYDLSFDEFSQLFKVA
jgi:isopenicillin N synthase-like dioxygenase